MNKRLFLLAVSCCFAAISLAQNDSAKIKYVAPAAFGGGAELSPCTGLFFLNDEASALVEDGWCFAQVGFTISHKKMQYTLQLGGMSAQLKQDLDQSVNWRAGNLIGSTHLEVRTAYELLNSKYFGVLPFASGGVVNFNTRVDENGADVLSRTNLRPTFALGSSFDFKLPISECKSKNAIPGCEMVDHHLALRLNTGVYPTYLKYPLDIDGPLYFASLGLVWYYRPGKVAMMK